MTEQYRALFVYDGDCGFCTRSIHFIQRVLRTEARHAIDFAPWQSLDLPSHGLTQRDVREAAHLIQPAGTRLAGAAAFGYLAGQGRAGWPLLGHALRLPTVNWLANRLYRLIAVNRHRLPGATAACEVPSK